MEESEVNNPTPTTDFSWVEAQSVKSKLQVLVLRHPREKKAKLGTAMLLQHALENVTVKTGLSWRNLKHALGQGEADSKKWAVLFLGTKKNFSLKEGEAVGIFDPKGKSVSHDQLGLEGIVVLDGSWRDVKGMWWKNAWLLKLFQIQLNPDARSQYGEMRKAPRKENLSTLEAVAMILSHLQKNPDIENKLDGIFGRFLSEKRKALLQE